MVSAIQILHLEDSSLDAELIRIRLAKVGLKAVIQRVVGHDDYLQALQHQPCDLILADYSMPGFDGLKALEYSQTYTPQVPFLFVSGAMGEEVAIETLKRGATDYILKHRLERLATAVRRALAEARDRAERRRIEQALRESERMHRLTLDSIRGHAILTLDADGRITSVNAGASEVLGYRDADLIGFDHALLFSAADAGNGLPVQELKYARRRGLYEVEAWHVRKDQSQFWGSSLVTLLLDENGDHRGYTKVVRDMTEWKQAEDSLHEADRRKNEFLAMLAHELRNPLSSIQNAAQLVRHEAITPEKSDWAKNVILSQVKHLAHLVDDLLDVARITQGKIRLRMAELNLREVLDRACEVARPMIEKQNQEFVVNLVTNPAWVRGDATRLEQVFTNLLTNAAKYTNPGGRIELSLIADEGFWVVRVADNGVGISAEMRKRVFDLFAQVDNSLDRSQGGLGIGLTISRSLIQLHEGTIEVESAGPGQGSVFSVRLAALDPQCVAPPTPTPAKRTPRSAGRILVVDDNQSTARALGTLLQLAGFTVRLAHDGLAALELCRQEPAETVLRDIGRTGMDGHEVAHRLRQEPTMRQAQIIAVTGYGEQQTRSDARSSEFDYHLVKPVDFDALIELIAPDRSTTTPTG